MGGNSRLAVQRRRYPFFNKLLNRIAGGALAHHDGIAVQIRGEFRDGLARRLAENVAQPCMGERMVQ
jgi:hypothetical protein